MWYCKCILRVPDASAEHLGKGGTKCKASKIGRHSWSWICGNFREKNALNLTQIKYKQIAFGLLNKSFRQIYFLICKIGQKLSMALRAIVRSTISKKEIRVYILRSKMWGFLFYTSGRLMPTEGVAFCYALHFV